MPRPLLAAGLSATALATLLFAAPALADVGPPPKCAAGSHDEYRMGHHCVPDGSHLAENPDGGAAAVVPDSPSEAAAKAVAAPPADRGCACGVASSREGSAGLVAGLALLFALPARARRRRRR